MKRISLNTKLIGIFLGITTIFIILFASLSLHRVETVIKDSAEKAIKIDSEIIINELRIWQVRNENKIIELADTEGKLATDFLEFIENRDETSREAVLSEIERVIFHNPSLEEISIINPDSHEVLITTSLVEQKKEEIELALTNKSQIYYCDRMESYTIALNSTINEPQTGVPVGIIIGNVNINSLSDILLNRADFEHSGQAYLVDKKGSYIFGINEGILTNHLVNEHGQKNLFDTNSVKQAIRGIKGAGQYIKHEGRKVYGRYELLPEFGFALIHEHETEHLYEIAIRLRKAIALIGFLILLATTVIGLYAVNKITNPIRKLTETANKVSNGNYGIRADIGTHDEIRDLSDSLNKMADTLVDSLKRSENIMQTLPNPLFILNSEGIIKNINQTSTELTGRSKKDLIGERFFNVILPHEFKGKELKGKTPKECFGKRNSTNLDAVCMTKHGENEQVNLSMSKIKKGSKTVGFIVVANDKKNLKKYARNRINEILPHLNRISFGDFSERLKLPEVNDEFTDLVAGIDLMSENLRKLIEENEKKTNQIKDHIKEVKEGQKELAFTNSLLKAQHEASEDGILAVGKNKKVLSYNKSVSRIWTLEEGNLDDPNFNMIDYLNTQIKGPKKLKKYIGELNSKIHKKARFEAETINGRIIDMQSAPLINDGKHTGYVFYFRDITKEVEIDKAKSEFVSLASHQLQTPLTAIKWLIELLKNNEKGNKENLALIEDAMQSTDRMTRLVDDLLNVSRLEMGTIVPNSEKVDYNKFIKSLVTEARVLGKQKNIEIELTKPSKNFDIVLDKNLVSQIVLNLLSNAIRYSKRNSKVIVATKKKRNKIEFSVKDQGIGISDEDQKKLFTKFFRTDRAAEFSATGSGLGLYMVKKIANVCEGDLILKSHEGKGSTFTVILPIFGPTNTDGKKGKTLIAHSINEL